METTKFKLNEVFKNNAKIYQSRPVIAARYKPGMENGYSVAFYYQESGEEGHCYFDTWEKAIDFYNNSPLQPYTIKGLTYTVQCEYERPKPVLIRRLTEEERELKMQDTILDNPFQCDEEPYYDVYYLDKNSWIIQEMDGSVRGWNPDCFEVTFFGENYVCEKVNDDTYIDIDVNKKI